MVRSRERETDEEWSCSGPNFSGDFWTLRDRASLACLLRSPEQGILRFKWCTIAIGSIHYVTCLNLYRYSRKSQDFKSRSTKWKGRTCVHFCRALCFLPWGFPQLLQRNTSKRFNSWTWNNLRNSSWYGCLSTETDNKFRLLRAGDFGRRGMTFAWHETKTRLWTHILDNGGHFKLKFTRHEALKINLCDCHVVIGPGQ